MVALFLVAVIAFVLLSEMELTILALLVVAAIGAIAFALYSGDVLCILFFGYSLLICIVRLLTLKWKEARKYFSYAMLSLFLLVLFNWLKTLWQRHP